MNVLFKKKLSSHATLYSQESFKKGMNQI